MAYPPTAQGDVVEVRIRGQDQGGATINVLHYMLDQVGTSVMPFDVFADAFHTELVKAGGFYERWYAAISNGWIHVQSEYQRVAPQRTPYVVKAVVGTGSVVEVIAPSFTTALIVKQSAVAGKGFSGRTFMPGFPRSWADQDTIQGIGQGPLDDVGNAIRDNQAVPPGTTIAVPIIWSHRRPNDRHTIARCYFSPFVRTLHRRAHGKGI